MPDPVWSKADTHCVWCGKPFGGDATDAECDGSCTAGAWLDTTLVKRFLSSLRATIEAQTGAWPEWLTPEYSAIHTAIENEMKKALEHCYDSTDASGLNWTTKGWISCSASNIIGMLRQLGCPPPPVGEVDALPMPEGHVLDEEAAEEFEAEWREELHGVVRQIVASAILIAPHDAAAIDMVTRRACDDLKAVAGYG